MTATAAKKHPQNVTLSADLVAAPQGPEQAVRQARSEAWRDDNRAALDAANRHVERHGLPLGKHLQF
ncbi:MAG: type II toxin-antitoxin system CcdA family antitoxin [Ferrovibrio sp.]